MDQILAFVDFNKLKATIVSNMDLFDNVMQNFDFLCFSLIKTKIHLNELIAPWHTFLC